MGSTTKQSQAVNADNVLAGVYNLEDKSITTSGFLVGKVGHKITYTSISSTIDDWSYLDGSSLLYTIRITYVDSTKEQILSAERTA